MEHTKGPWEVVPQHGFSNTWRIFSGMKDVASIDCSCKIRTEANARLIAAAPNLFEACKVALIELSGINNGPECKILADAIAKAEGRQS